MNILNNYIGSKTVETKSSPVKNIVNQNSTTKTSIFYINDLHGQIPKMQRLVSASDQITSQADKNGSDLLRLCSGDTFIGSDDKRNIAAASFLDMAQIDAETLGNHEFDITASICGNLLKNSKTQILGMNMNFPDNNSELSKKVLRSTVIEGKNGEKYGLIGLQPSDINQRLTNKERLDGITIDDKEETFIELQHEVDKLKQQGLNKIILLSHQGYNIEREIAQSIRGIDVILGGHSHDLIKDVVPGENLFYSPDGEPVVITQAGRDGNHFGLLNLEFNDKGQITYIQNNIMDTNLYDSNILMEKTVDSILGKSPEIGYLSYVDPIPANNLMEENPWADFVSDAVRKNLDADIVLINSANFRGSVDYGTITERDIMSIFPFNNKLAKCKISEKDIVEAIKSCGKTLTAKNHKPGLLQVSGLSYTLNSQGDLISMKYIDKQNQEHIIDVNNPDPNKMYNTVLDDFLYNGGDGLSMLKRQESDFVEKYDFPKDKVTIDYIKSIAQPFEVRKDNRIQIIP